VVSNTKYTKAAEELASTNKVFLLHYSDLCRLENIIGLESCEPDLKSEELERVWCYDDGTGELGPLTIEELTQTLDTLPNACDVLVRTTGSAWKRAKDVPELRVTPPPRSRWSLSLPPLPPS
jgi:hypothetical protein